jgi:hypothetical protein
MARNAGILYIHCVPRFVYICCVKSGKAALKGDYSIEFAARIEVAYIVYVLIT